MTTRPFDFNEIIALLNKTKSVSIDLEPREKRDGRWSLHDGRYKVHTSTMAFDVLYLSRDVTNENVDEAHRFFHPGHTHVVYAPSLDNRGRRYYRERFGSPEDHFWSSRDYIQSFIRDELNAYIDKVKTLDPRYYIDPQVTTPAGTKGKIPNPLLSALRAPRFEKNTSEGLSILLGEPGQGKTFMSQFLVYHLAQSGSFVPIYINSSQWESMPRDHLGSLLKTIAHSFRFFEAPIGWIDGQEDLFLRTTLRADLFRIIFDGFDEYVLRNEGRTSVSDVLDELSDLAASTGARILITSRSSFWDSNVNERSFVTGTGAAVYRIVPFDSQHARNYYQRRFGTKHPNVNRAVNVYSLLAKRDPKFVGRGFVLKLVGDLIGEPGSPEPQQLEGAAMHSLMQAFCDREVLRQGLPLNGSDQLTALETFAAEVAMGAEPSSESLAVCVGETAPQLSAAALEDCVKRMRPHPLLSRAASSDSWEWSQEQIGHVFLAEWVRRQASRGARGQAALQQFLANQRLRSSQMTDLASMLVDLATETSQGSEAGDEVAQAIREILKAARSGKSAAGSRDGRALATTIAMKAVDKHKPAGSTHKERTSLLVNLLDGPPVEGVAFSGTIARMDFHDTMFLDCRFDRVMWANVRLDASTVFKRCHFTGGLTEHTTGLGLCLFDDCTSDDEARAMLRIASTREGGTQYTREDLRTDFGTVVGKFITGSGFLQTLHKRNLPRGTIRESRYGREVIEQVVSRILEQHHISGASEGGYHVRDDAKEAVLFFAANGVFSGPLKEAFEDLAQRLRLK